MKLLLKTPILNDFSEEKQKDVKLPIEKELFEKYTKKFREEKGIKLVRKLYGIVAKKKQVDIKVKRFKHERIEKSGWLRRNYQWT